MKLDDIFNILNAGLFIHVGPVVESYPMFIATLLKVSLELKS